MKASPSSKHIFMYSYSNEIRTHQNTFETVTDVERKPYCSWSWHSPMPLTGDIVIAVLTICANEYSFCHSCGCCLKQLSLLTTQEELGWSCLQNSGAQILRLWNVGSALPQSPFKGFVQLTSPCDRMIRPQVSFQRLFVLSRVLRPGAMWIERATLISHECTHHGSHAWPWTWILRTTILWHRNPHRSRYHRLTAPQCRFSQTTRRQMIHSMVQIVSS